LHFGHKRLRLNSNTAKSKGYMLAKYLPTFLTHFQHLDVDPYQCHKQARERLARKDTNIRVNEAEPRRQTKKRKKDQAIAYRSLHPQENYSRIVQKFDLDVPEATFRKWVSRHKPEKSCAPPSESESPCDTPKKQPTGELHDKVMAEASAELASAWKKAIRQKQRQHPKRDKNASSIIKKYQGLYPKWPGVNKSTLTRRAQNAPGAPKKPTRGSLLRNAIGE